MTDKRRISPRPLLHANKRQRRSRDRLPWNPSFLVQFAARLIENLGGMQAGFAAYLAQSVVFRWGSACSGTESPHWVFGALAEAAFAQVVFEHVYSAEIEATKREWIKNMAQPSCLLSDIFDITRTTARCAIAGIINVKQVCHSMVVDLFIAGFSCKTVSALNADPKTRRQAISDYRGSTGITWWGVVATLQRTRPRSFILENVEGLMRHDSHLLVVEKLESLGYIVIWRLCDALECGLPQHRPRIWFLGWLRSLVAYPDSFRRRMCDVFADLFHDHPLMCVDEFLLNEEDSKLMQDTDDKVEAHYANMSRPTRGGTKWIEKNKVMCKKKRVSQCQSNWSVQLDETYPEYRLLSERCKSSLDRHNIKCPKDTPTIIRLDQTEAGISRRQAPCITPGGVYGVGHRCRLLRGTESMALQGFPLTDSRLSEYSSAFLQNLAGNAFNVPNAMVAIVCVIAGFSVATACEEPKPDATVSVPGAFNPTVDTDSDDE